MANYFVLFFVLLRIPSSYSFNGKALITANGWIHGIVKFVVCSRLLSLRLKATRHSRWNAKPRPAPPRPAPVCFKTPEKEHHARTRAWVWARLRVKVCWIGKRWYLLLITTSVVRSFGVDGTSVPLFLFQKWATQSKFSSFLLNNACDITESYLFVFS